MLHAAPRFLIPPCWTCGVVRHSVGLYAQRMLKSTWTNELELCRNDGVIALLPMTIASVTHHCVWRVFRLPRYLWVECLGKNPERGELPVPGNRPTESTDRSWPDLSHTGHDRFRTQADPWASRHRAFNWSIADVRLAGLPDTGSLAHPPANPHRSRGADGRTFV